MDTVSAVISVTGVVGTLAGVAMGSWFSGRNERWRLKETHRREDRQARVSVCIEYLTVSRRARSYLLTNEKVEVVLQAGSAPGQEAPFVRGIPEITDTIQRVTGHLRLLEGGPTPIYVAAGKIQKASEELLLVRARQPLGGLPADLVEATREAERAFIRIAHRELGLS